MFIWNMISLPFIEIWAAHLKHLKIIQDGKNVRKSRFIQNATSKKTVQIIKKSSLAIQIYKAL